MSIDVAALPRSDLPQAQRLYRIHRTENGPWYFDGSDDARFNPSATDGRGACYWTESPLGAFIEVFRATRTIDAADLDARRLAHIDLPAPLVVADLTQRAGLALGVTLALTAGEDHSEAQAVADQLQGTVDGVLWHGRHDLAGQLTCVALFGLEGAPSGRALAQLPQPTSTEIPAPLVFDAEQAFGYTVLPRPR